MFDIKPNKERSIKDILIDLIKFNRDLTNEKIENFINFLELRIKIGELSENDLKIVQNFDWNEGNATFLVKHKNIDIEMFKKLIQLDMRPCIVDKIYDELKILYELNSPYIVSFYGSYNQKDDLNICNEYMNRGSLESILLKVNRIPENIIATIARFVLNGLNYLKKSSNLIHGYLKPSNILFNSKGEVKLGDLIIYKLTNDINHNKSIVKSYHSPQKINGCLSSYEDDIWSLGFCLVEMAVGRYPIPEIKHEEIKILFEMYPLIGRKERKEYKIRIFDVLCHIIEKPSPSLPRDYFNNEFVEFVDICLDKEPSKRGDFDTLLDHEFIRKYSNQSDDAIASWLNNVFLV